MSMAVALNLAEAVVLAERAMMKPQEARLYSVLAAEEVETMMEMTAGGTVGHGVVIQ